MNIALIIIFVCLGVALLLLEIFFLPGITISGIAGAIFLLAAILTAFATFGSTFGWLTLFASVLLLAVFVALFIRGKFWKKISLNSEISSKVETENLTVKVGEKGVCISRLTPIGNVRFADNVLEVKSLSGFIDVGSEIEAIEVSENEILVKKSNG
jgi:membrane-bound ClpP family serine protease